jgi:hypothetical protein
MLTHPLIHGTPNIAEDVSHVYVEHLLSYIVLELGVSSVFSILSAISIACTLEFSSKLLPVQVVSKNSRAHILLYMGNLSINYHSAKLVDPLEDVWSVMLREVIRLTMEVQTFSNGIRSLCIASWV